MKLLFFLEDNFCIYDLYKKVQKIKEKNCLPPLNDIQYESLYKDDEFINDEYSGEIVFGWFNVMASWRTIKQEILLHDEASLIGSLGGFLGLFVGFSFHGTICCIIDFFFTYFWFFTGFRNKPENRNKHRLFSH